jgi:organic radical activating enzyme
MVMNKGDEAVGNKSKFMASAEWMKEHLGEGFCLAKWKQVSLHLPTGLNNSCYHPPLHHIDPAALQGNPGALHNTEHKKQQRVIMLKNERPGECQYCWNIEDTGNLSDRHYRSGEPWAAEDYEAIRASTGTEDWIPSYVEVNFNHACNLACSYCSPQFSSTWQAEVDKWGAWPTSTPHNAPEHFQGRNRPIPHSQENPYVDAFWEWWPQLYPKLKHFRMTGGEPLMDRNTYRVFDYVLALPNPELHLNVTSNFSVEPKLFEKYLDYVKRLCGTQIEHFMQYVSLDTGEPQQAEYIRHGLNFRRMWDYVHRYLDEIPYRNSLTFIITMNNLSVLGIQRQLEWILDLRRMYSKTYQRVWFDTPLLRQPKWQSLQILPPVYADRLERVADWMELNLERPEDPFHGFKDYEVQRMRRDIAWMREGQKLDHDYIVDQRADFYRFFNEHDKRRGTDFERTFPEMREFWQECRYHAQR